MGRAVGHVRANLVGYLALFVALGGTGYAASKIGSDDIRRNAVRSKHIAKEQVKKGDVSKTSLSGLFGSGVMLGELRSYSVGPGSTSSGAAPFGLTANTADAFDVAVPAQFTVRDLRVAKTGAGLPPGTLFAMSVLRTRRGATTFLTCEIPPGRTDCFTGSRKLRFEPGDTLSAMRFLAGGSVGVPAEHYRFGYRIVPE